MATANRRLRLPLLDIPLGLLIGLVSLAVARLSGEFANQPAGPSGYGPSGMPPWQHGRGGGPGGPGWQPPQTGTDLGEPYTGSALLWVLILVLGVAARRLRPITGYALTVVAATGYLGVGLPFGPVLIGPALGLATMATRMSARRWAPWAGLLAPMIWAGFVSEPALGLTDPMLYTTVLLLGGAMISPALFATLRRNRLDAGRRTRELELRRAAYQERLRVARDVHDLVGHSLSVINMQAGVALYVLNKDQDADPHRIEESLQAIRSTSKNALDELRATLAVFRGETGDQRAPVGGLARIPELVAAVRGAGRTVRLIMDEKIGELPGPIDSAAYRIVQEALTNVARHAGDAAATVRIERRDDELIIEVINDGPPVRIPADHDGNGLIGMAERAESVGGAVEVGPRPEGGFLVHAEFPLSVSRNAT